MAPTPDSFEDLTRAYAAAWSARDPEAVAALYEADGWISINGGERFVGRQALEGMVGGFLAEVPDLVVRLDQSRLCGENALFLWTLEGRHAASGKQVAIPGWESWLLSDTPRIKESLGFFDAEDYQRQIDGT